MSIACNATVHCREVDGGFDMHCKTYVCPAVQAACHPESCKTVVSPSEMCTTYSCFKIPPAADNVGKAVTMSVLATAVIAILVAMVFYGIKKWKIRRARENYARINARTFTRDFSSIEVPTFGPNFEPCPNPPTNHDSIIRGAQAAPMPPPMPPTTPANQSNLADTLAKKGERMKISIEKVMEKMKRGRKMYDLRTEERLIEGQGDQSGNGQQEARMERLRRVCKNKWSEAVAKLKK